MTHPFHMVDGNYCCISCGKWEDAKRFHSEGPEFWCSSCGAKRTERLRKEAGQRAFARNGDHLPGG